ncbi:hypothetical protein M885DRAFT_520388 [Pelagophyceae sp. CCMP2097]|nr:hypothetical protein M885DRAFT_520388 [Pelagophyceae sp. CCMP2097]
MAFGLKSNGSGEGIRPRLSSATSAIGAALSRTRSLISQPFAAPRQNSRAGWDEAGARKYGTARSHSWKTEATMQPRSVAIRQSTHAAAPASGRDKDRQSSSSSSAGLYSATAPAPRRTTLVIAHPPTPAPRHGSADRSSDRRPGAENHREASPRNSPPPTKGFRSPVYSDAARGRDFIGPALPPPPGRSTVVSMSSRESTQSSSRRETPPAKRLGTPISTPATKRVRGSDEQRTPSSGSREGTPRAASPAPLLDYDTARRDAELTVQTLLRRVIATNPLGKKAEFEQRYDDAWLQKQLDDFRGREPDFVVNVRNWCGKFLDPTGPADDGDADAPRRPAGAAPRREAAPPGKADGAVICEKCDGAHVTEACPHFKGGRDDHPDAKRKKFQDILGTDEGNAYLAHADVVRQPGDGSCLFHSLAHGLGRLGSARSVSGPTLRAGLMDWLGTHQETKISDTPLREWVKWDSDTSVESYAARMRGGGWGGGIEMAAFAHLYDVGVHVYERSSRGGGQYPFKRISRFDARSDGPAATQQSAAAAGRRSFVAVLYCGGVHYDALVAHGDPIELDADAAPGAAQPSRRDAANAHRVSPDADDRPPVYRAPNKAHAYKQRRY